MIKNKPYGITLIEVMISLLILSIVSVMSLNILGNLNVSVKKIIGVADQHRGFIGAWRMLENDFFENSFIPEELIQKNLYVEKNSLIFPNGVSWQWGNGELIRKSYNIEESPKLKVLKNINRLELEIWDGTKFISYSADSIKNFSKNIKKNLFGPRLGFKVKLVESNEVVFQKVFVLEGTLK